MEKVLSPQFHHHVDEDSERTAEKKNYQRGRMGGIEMEKIMKPKFRLSAHKILARCSSCVQREREREQKS
jgi:hypothetical protein